MTRTILRVRPSTTVSVAESTVATKTRPPAAATLVGRPARGMATSGPRPPGLNATSESLARSSATLRAPPASSPLRRAAASAALPKSTPAAMIVSAGRRRRLRGL